MTILLQDRRSSLFFVPPCDWVSDAQSATPFRSSSEALMTASNYHLNGMQVLLKFDHADYDVALPLRGDDEAAPALHPPLQA